MKKLFVWLASVSICAAQAVSIGPFATEGWVEDRIQSMTNDFATVKYVDAVSNAIPDTSTFSTVEYVNTTSNNLALLIDDLVSEEELANIKIAWDSVTNKPPFISEDDVTTFVSNIVPRWALVPIPPVTVEIDPAFTNWLATTNSATVQYVDDHRWDWETQVTNAPDFATPVEVTNIVDVAVSNRLNSSTMAEVYDPEKTYFAGDYATYNGNLYKCLAENTGTFDTNKWQAIQLYKNKLYDAEVEYIVLGQGAYISSGIGYYSGNGGFLDFSHRFMFDPSTPHTVSWANGHLPGGSTSRNLIGFFGSSAHPENIYVCPTVAYDGNYRTSVVVPSSEFEEKFSEIKVDGTSVYLNGELVATATRSGASSTPNTSYLIGSNDSAQSHMGNGVLNIKIRFAETTLTKDGVLVRDFIPVRKGNVGYYYDRVSGQLFGNAGTGTIPPGPDKAPKLPSMDGEASAGTDDEYARFDHVHPSDTSKADKSYVDSHRWDWSTQITNPPAFPTYEDTTLTMGSRTFDLSKMLEGAKTNSFENIWFDVRNGKGRFSFEQDGYFWCRTTGGNPVGYDGLHLIDSEDRSLRFATNNVLKAGTIATVEDLAGFADKAYVDSHQWDWATQITNKPINVSAFNNDAGYVTANHTHSNLVNGATEIVANTNGTGSIVRQTYTNEIRWMNISFSDDFDAYWRASGGTMVHIYKDVDANQIVYVEVDKTVRHDLPLSLRRATPEEEEQYISWIQVGYSADQLMDCWFRTTISGGSRFMSPNAGVSFQLDTGAYTSVSTGGGYTFDRGTGSIWGGSLGKVTVPAGKVLKTIATTDDIEEAISGFITSETDPVFNEWTNRSVLVAGSGAISTGTDFNSTVLGDNAKAYAGSTLAVGNNVTARSNFDVAVGVYETEASGGYSTAVGSYAKATGDASIAIGCSSTASGENSVVIGRSTSATHPNSVSIGTSVSSHGPGTFNINPEGGAAGVWIGETNLATYLAGGGGPITETDPKWTQFKDMHRIWSKIGTDSYGNTITNLVVLGALAVGAHADLGSLNDLGFANGVVSIEDGGIYSTVLGLRAVSSNAFVFVYSGRGDTEYADHGTGTFNVDPYGGAEGFWIGETNLATHLDGSSKLALDAIAPAFSISSVYTNGDYVIYDRHLYECTNYTGTAGWRANDWQQTTVTGILGNLRRILDVINGEAL